MTLSTRIQILFILLVGLVVGVGYAALQLSVMPTFHKLEGHRAFNDAERMNQIIETEFSFLRSFLIDWAVWDSTYEFVLGMESDFLEEDLIYENFDGLSLDIFYFFDRQGGVKWGEAYDPNTSQKVILEGFANAIFESGLTAASSSSVPPEVSGFVQTSLGPAMFIALPVLRSDEGGPHAGFVLGGRFLRGQLMQDWKDRTKVAFGLFAPDSELLPENIMILDEKGDTGHPPLPPVLEGGTIDIGLPLKDPKGDVAFMLTTHTPRDFTSVGARAVGDAFLLILSFGIALILVFGIVIRRAAIAPLVELTEVIEDIERNQDFSKRSQMIRKDEIGMLSSKFDAMLQRLSSVHEFAIESKKKAELASKSKSQFLARMSHEIRTPMNGIIGMTDVLAKSHLNEKQSRSLSTIRQSADALLGIINDILDFSKIESGKFRLRQFQFNLCDCVFDVCEMFTQMAEDKNIQLKYTIPQDIPKYFVGDGDRLRQVLVNLVGNAIKFTDEGQVSLEVAFLSSDKRDAELKFSIIDTGVGIPDWNRETLFDAFEQVDGSSSRKYGGTGLGLTISSELVSLMGGTIGFESELGVGSTFWFTCCLMPAEHGGQSGGNECPDTESHLETASSLSDCASPQYKASVLVAEDNLVNQEVIRAQLEDMGITPNIVSTGREAVSAFDESSYDIIFMDVQMPDIDGLEATNFIRQIEGDRLTGTRTPIIALTAQVMEGDKDSCLKAGMDDYLSKPVRSEDLSKVLDRWIAEREHHGESTVSVQGDSEEDLSDQSSQTVDPSVLDALRSLQKPGKPDFLDQVLKIYLENASKLILAMEIAVESQNLEEFGKAVHALKSSSANVGAIRLSSLCKRVEEQTRSGLMPNQDLYLELCSESESVNRTLKAELSNVGTRKCRSENQQ